MRNGLSKELSKWITSCLGLGLLPKAPGTWGSLGALFFWAAVGSHMNSWWIYGLCLVGFTLIGVWAIRIQNEGDKSSIVIDEWVGMGLALSTSSFWWPELVLAFLLFRGFDIFKPLGIRWLDRNLKNAWGVMLDDVLAGVYSAVVLFFLIYFGAVDELFTLWHSY